MEKAPKSTYLRPPKEENLIWAFYMPPRFTIRIPVSMRKRGVAKRYSFINEESLTQETTSSFFFDEAT